MSVIEREQKRVLLVGTRGEWATDFLHALGNANPDASTQNLVAAWTKAENTDARYNPLATTLDYGNNTKFNYAGVKNYQSRQQGIEASVTTLKGNHAGYAKLAGSLIKNDPQGALLSGGLETWGSGSGAVGTIWMSDIRGEELKSETGGRGSNPEPILPGTAAPNPLGPEGSAPGGYSDKPQETGQLTGETVKGYFKIAGGIGLGIIAVIVLLVAFAKSDTGKAVADVAKVAAL